MIMKKENIINRWVKLFVYTGSALFFVYGLLPALTKSFPLLEKMAYTLEENDIDPSRYYYSDVAQVKEGELYLREVLAPEVFPNKVVQKSEK